MTIEKRVEFIHQIVRVVPELKPYFSIIGVGLSFLLSTWHFPEILRNGAKNTRIRLSPEDADAIDYLMMHSGKSATEIVTAALLRAKNSKVRPPARTRRGSE